MEAAASFGCNFLLLKIDVAEAVQAGLPPVWGVLKTPGGGFPQSPLHKSLLAARGGILIWTVQKLSSAPRESPLAAARRELEELTWRYKVRCAKDCSAQHAAFLALFVCRGW